MEKFNAPPGWNVPPHPWTPPPGFQKEEGWPDAPEGWEFWIESFEIEGQRGSSKGEFKQESNLSFAESLENESKARLIELNDEITLQAAGIYDYHHPLENSVHYKAALDDLRKEMKKFIRNRKAILSKSNFYFDNSAAKGSKLVSELSALALNFFNQEAENALRTMRYGTLDTARKRVLNSADKIARFGKLMELSVSEGYLAIKLKELELHADYLAKVQEEKQIAKNQKEVLREEAKVKKELELQRVALLKEFEHVKIVLETLREQGQTVELDNYQQKLNEIQIALDENDYRRTNVRAGYVYVISNEGAFGPGVIKIGMTRRLDPMDRIRELGDASVPFRFSLHVMFFSDDALGLELSLHEHFAARRLNHVNKRKEFFFATPIEVKHALLRLASGALIDFNEKALSEEFLESRGLWPSRN